MRIRFRSAAIDFLVLVVVLILHVSAAPTAASTLQIQFGELDMIYDGSAIYGTAEGAECFVDGSLVGALGGQVQIYIPGVFRIPAAGGTRMSTGPFPSFGLNVSGGLVLDFDSPAEVVYSPYQLSVLGSMSTNIIVNQGLPLGLRIGTPIYVGFDVQTIEVTDDGEYITSFRAVGVGDVRGPLAGPIPVAPTTWGELKQKFQK